MANKCHISFLQDQCNGRGYCQCGVCQCEDPYFGEYCELCSGEDICRVTICAPDNDDALCASCVFDLLEMLNATGIGVFTPAGFEAAVLDGLLPVGSMLTRFPDEPMDVMAIQLPANFTANCGMSENVTCPPLAIINETMSVDYMIEGKYMKTHVCSTLHGCKERREPRPSVTTTNQYVYKHAITK